MLGKYWFNGYLPFGASSCTSLAQRQSDAIREIASVYGVKAKLVAILDDFLLVCTRRKGESDDSVLERGRKAGEKFDNLLEELHLPKAPEKDQAPAFSTVWFGIEFFSKSQTYGLPQKKWENLGLFFKDTFLLNDGEDFAPTVRAEQLQTALGKFHHAVLVWPAGRPSLYALWRLFYSATFSYRKNRTKKPVLFRPKQQLTLNEEAQTSLTFWKNRLDTRTPPLRRMLMCSKAPDFTWINIFLFNHR